MRTEAKAALQQVLANPSPDPRVVKGLTMMVKATNEYERETGELNKALQVGLNPTSAGAQRVALPADARPRASAAVQDTDRGR